MRKQNSIVLYVVVFTLAQLAWLSMLGLWIYWYVSNYIILTEAGEWVSSRLIESNTNTGALISGIILLVAIAFGMSLIFIYLTRQMNITRFYDNFIANVTHELKSPLSSIQLYLETIKKRDLPPERKSEFIDRMLDDTDRLNGLITSILDISRLEQKKLAYDFHVYPADKLIRELIGDAAVDHQIPPDGISIEGDLRGEVVVDKRAMRIIINNLIDNAVKYSPDPVSIRVILRNNRHRFVITITDSGIGIRAQHQKRIFQKFQRIYNPGSPNVTGTGLGLYWVRQIIKVHGGTVTVTSPGPDKGTTFRIDLPVYQSSKRMLVNRLLKLTQRKNQNREYDHDF